MSGEVNCGYWNGDLLFFFFSAIGYMGFKWHILGDGSFVRKQGRRRKGSPLSPMFYCRMGLEAVRERGWR